MGPAVVAACSTEAARFAVEHWHYSGAMPAGKLVKYGAWEDDEYVGAVVFGRGASVPAGIAMQRDYDLEITEWCELVRVALRDHETPTSAILSDALRQLHRDNPGLRLVVSFADPEAGHVGTLYQATNWIYTGRSAAVRQWFIRGRWRHERMASPYARKLGTTRERIPTRWTPGKFRYVYPLDRAIRRRVEAARVPFPRGLGLEGEPSGDQPEGAGSTPAARS